MIWSMCLAATSLYFEWFAFDGRTTCHLVLVVASWRGGAGATALSYILENRFACWKIVFQKHKIWRILGKFRGKIEILSTHISTVGNFQLSVGKLHLCVPQTFLTYDTASKYARITVSKKYQSFERFRKEFLLPVMMCFCCTAVVKCWFSFMEILLILIWYISNFALWNAG